MGYTILHLDKTYEADTKMSDYIGRKTISKNTEPTQMHLKRELVEFSKGAGSRNQAINHRLESTVLDEWCRDNVD